MIRSSALLVVAAIALLAAGVFASSLELVYVSIGVSILAAVALLIGVVVRRGELFGAAGTARQGASPSRPPADITGVPAVAGGRAGRGAWGDDGPANGSRQARPAAAGANSGREDVAAEPIGPVTGGKPGGGPVVKGSSKASSVKGGAGKGGAAKGGSGAARRAGERSGHAAGRGRPAASPAGGLRNR